MARRTVSGSPATTTVAGPARARRRARRRLVCARTYGLTAAEIRAEMRRLSSRGFQLWEIARVFGCNCKTGSTTRDRQQ